MKTINDLKLGDSVWFEGEEYQFGGFCRGKPHRYVQLCRNNEHKRAGLEEQIQLTKPLPKLEKGQPIWVRDFFVNPWLSQAFSHWQLGNEEWPVSTLGNPFDETSAIEWHFWKLPTKSELEKAGFNPERWQFRNEED